MVICGQTFDFSPLNANDIERLETANEKHVEKLMTMLKDHHYFVTLK